MTLSLSRAWWMIGAMLLVLGLGSTAVAGPLKLTSPTSRAIYQRSPDGAGVIALAGVWGGGPAALRARVVPAAPGQGVEQPWAELGEVHGRFEVTLPVSAGGWYGVEVEVVPPKGAKVVMHVVPVGLGEVFVIGGQSNAANTGQPPQAPKDDRVSTLGPRGWKLARDPQPLATWDGGSPWPHLGDLLVERLGVPVGFVALGWGGSSVGRWKPTGKIYGRLGKALAQLGPNGARALLWHQGEADTMEFTAREVYVERLNAVIAASRKDAGWSIPWIIAGVSYPGADFADAPRLAHGKVVRLAQDDVIAADPLALAGPTTDDMIGPRWRHDGTHFNADGLNEHGRRWFEVVMRELFGGASAPSGTPR